MEITPSRIGFVATHFNGIDRVSLESKIWHAVLNEMGHECFFFAGDSNQPEERTVIVPEADYRNQDIDLLNQEIYQDGKRSSKTSGTIQALRFHIKQHLHQFIQTFDINLLVAENALSLPLNIPLGLALSEVIAETGITCLARHHEFAWEHVRFYHSPATDYTLSNFPPKLPSLQHVVATTAHADELASRAGVNARVIPYARDFNSLDSTPTSSASDLPQTLGISSDAPTALLTSPITPASKIDTALALVTRMDHKPELLLTSEGFSADQDYLKYCMETAELLQVPVHLVGEHSRTSRNDDDDYSSKMAQVYELASFAITFGHTQGAAAEASDAIYHGKALVTSKYNLAVHDLKVRGFRFFEVPLHPDLAASRDLEQALQSPELVSDMVEQNLKLGRQLLTIESLKQKLSETLQESLTA